MAESFLLAWRALLRGHVLTALLALPALAHFLLPAVVRSDGTDAGAREVFLRVVPGSVYVVLCVALVACACGLIAHARESHRLALAAVRPVCAGTLVLGPLLALVAVAGIVLAFNMGLTCARGGWTDCRHVYEPVLEPPEKAAKQALEDLLSDVNVSEEIRKAPRYRLLAILTGREIDRYETIHPARALELPFPNEVASAPDGVTARIRFSTQFNTRASLSGVVTFGPLSAVVSNSTQAILNKLGEMQTQTLQDKLEAERDKNTALKGEISQLNQNQYIAGVVGQNMAPLAAQMAALNKEVDDIKCKLPNTVNVQYPNLVAVNATPYVSGGIYPNGMFGGYGNYGNYGF